MAPSGEARGRILCLRTVRTGGRRQALRWYQSDGWRAACAACLPIWVGIRVSALCLTLLAPLWQIPLFSTISFPISTLWKQWDEWDTGHFLTIAMHGYPSRLETAFFPLYPLGVRGLTVLLPHSLTCALLLSNVAGLAMLVVLYRLLKEDFCHAIARHTVLLLSLFPTAFFFVAAYNESLFLALILLSFSQMRRGNFWLAGFIGLFASLTRSAGLLLLIPFVYEYWRRGRIRFDVLAMLAIPGGAALFALYCHMHFGDALAFMHAQAYWSRHLAWPWQGMQASFEVLLSRPHRLTFDVLHNVIDLSAGLFIGLLVLLSFVGPYRFKREHRSYALFGLVLLLFPLLEPAWGKEPLQSLSRLVLEVFPAFVVLAQISVKHRIGVLCYVVVSVSLMAFLLSQFLTGHWVV